MKKGLIGVLAMVILGLVFSAEVFASVITFDDPSQPLEGGREYYASSYYYPTTRPNYYIEGEYMVGPPWGSMSRMAPGYDSGFNVYLPEYTSGNFIAMGGSGDVLVRRVDGQPFDLVSFDCAAFPGGFNQRIWVTGYPDLTSWIPVVEGNFPVVPGNGFPEVINGGMGRINLGPEWQDLSGVLFRCPPVLLDNFQCSAPVPIPGAVWLLGSGIVGLFGLRRRWQ